MSRSWVFYAIIIFFLWIIYLRMEKDAEVTDGAKTQSKTKQKGHSEAN